MNVVADALSRKPVLTLMKFHDDWKAQLGVEYAKNQFSYDLFDGLIHDNAFKILNDIIYHKDRIFPVLESSSKKNILEAFHDAPLVGHLRFVKTYRKVREKFSWKGLKK